MWSTPDDGLLKASNGALYVCTYGGTDDLHIIKIEAIVSVVAIIPMMPSDGDEATRFFVVEKPGLDALIMGQQNEEHDEEI
jgi:hypothetical protein